MKKKYLIILLLSFVLLPFKVSAAGGFNVSSGSINMYPGDTKTITISSWDSVGRLNVSSSNGSVVSVSTDKIFIDSPGASKSLTITAKTLGSSTITVVGTADYATYSASTSLEGLTKTITVNVVNKPAPKPVTPSAPSNNNNNSNNANTNNNVNNNNANQAEENKSDATLNSLVISGVNLEFDKNKTEYSVKVSNDINKLDIKATATSSKAKVEIPNNLNLKVGNNTIKIKVIAEDKTEKIYTINVERLNRELSKNNYLKDIKIKGYKIDFKKDVFVYDIGKIDKNKLDIEAILEDKTATYEIKGNSSIGKNDVIVIKVTAEDNSVREYIIYANNTKEAKESKLTPAIIISITTIILILIPMIVGFIKDRKKVELN